MCKVAVYFDASSLRSADVREFLKLSDGLLIPSYMTHASAIPVPKGPADPEFEPIYLDCERRTLAFEEGVRQHPPPAVLAPVVEYFRSLFVLNLLIGRALQRYCDTGDLGVLKDASAKADRTTACEEALRALSTDVAGRCGRATQVWGTCMIQPRNKDRGDYPKDAWAAFLKQAGIRLVQRDCEP